MDIRDLKKSHEKNSLKKDVIPVSVKNEKLHEIIFDRMLYREWRETQRTQLGINANLYIIFSSAMLGYLLKFIVSNKGEIEKETHVTLMIGFGFLLLSLIFMVG